MSDRPDRSGSVLGNANTWLALLTICGGLWLVSQKLTSSRPVSTAESSVDSIGDQRLEARLWEDPFKPPPSATGRGEDLCCDLGTLVREMQRLSPGAYEQPQGNLVLPVMVSGGNYSEDRESRVRSRYAVVSALGRSDYAPADPEHLGVLRIPWPTARELRAARSADCLPDPSLALARDASRCAARDCALVCDGHLAGSGSMEVRYEWYRRKIFAHDSGPRLRHRWVLVLWLDEAKFADEPLLRLALLLQQLSDPAWYLGRQSPRVALVGPRTTSTLRAMLPTWGQAIDPAPHQHPAALDRFATCVLSRVELYCATPSTIDEVLVKAAPNPVHEPRRALQAALTARGFGRVQHFSATDAQLAAAVLDELELRRTRTEPSEENLPGRRHIVLISEWDSFYGRMLSLTYEQEMKRRRNPHFDQAEFIASWTGTSARKIEPNFHSFVYLRGLDGQTVGASSGGNGDKAERRGGQFHPSSLEEIRDWTPDLNRAEGPAQFDYLGRIGDRIGELQHALRRSRQGRIAAIGIVGSDVYDVLLILQALGPRFPHALFFTTDLDVRFLHPQEQPWARNLIVVSSYGLTLHPELQGSIAPFRDSTQTAQFAAVLAALGHPTLAGLKSIPPRRFEIGNQIAVDLSTRAEHDAEPEAPPSGSPLLHPPTASEEYESRSRHARTQLCLIAILTGALALGCSRMWQPLRRVTWDWWSYPARALHYQAEDVGGPDGAAELVRRMARWPRLPLAQALLAHPPIQQAQQRLAQVEQEHERVTRWSDQGIVTPGVQTVLAEQMQAITWKRERALGQLCVALVAALQSVLLQHDGLAAAAGFAPNADPEKLRRRRARWMLREDRGGYPWHRLRMDELLDRICRTPDPRCTNRLRRLRQAVRRKPLLTLRLLLRAKRAIPPKQMTVSKFEADEADEVGALRAAAAARRASRRTFWLRIRHLLWFWFAMALLAWTGVGLGQAVWNDTLVRSTGEPFSLWTGVSAWPGAIVRACVAALALWFLLGLQSQLRQAFCELTRKFRLAPPRAGFTSPAGEICAETMWLDYHRRTGTLVRLGRGLLLLGVYVVLVLAILHFSEDFFIPWRGDSIRLWDTWLLSLSSLGVIALAILTMDASAQCRHFIDRLSDYPTYYPIATRQHFRRQFGQVDDYYLEEWIDLQLIADLTERVGRLVYYPTALWLLLMLARNTWWDRWSWPIPAMIVQVLNLALALASVVIVQRAAKGAKAKAERTLSEKLKKLHAQLEPNAARNTAARADELLQEIRQLDRGAFVPLWENPVLGAIFLSSGGTTLVQGVVWFLAR